MGYCKSIVEHLTRIIMAYLSKSTILKAYEVLSSIDEDKRQGLTQKVSALKYGIALGMYYKKYGDNCDLKIATNKDTFASLVGRVVKINDRKCTKDFFTSIAPNGRDYDCGSNFYSQSSVKDSKTNSSITLLYPKRSGWQPVMDVSNQVLIYNSDYIKSSLNFYLSSPLLKFSFAIWLLRFENIETNDIVGLKGALSKLLTEDYCNVLFPVENDDSILFSIEFDETKSELTDKDIVSMFSGNIKEPQLRLPLQQIFYGAPGTGKSHRIKNDERVKAADEKNLVFRTTFHPDSDYSTFVGAYKPTMQPVADKYKAVAGKDEEITYSFVPQAFLQAYVTAWNHQEDDVFLVIEEINRGNCAQIFGDLFQLLDRDDEGYSEYPIRADIDLVRYLEEGKDENGQDILVNKDGIKDRKLKLPSNLYIWATMNTSDQSLFPIDSAFKRRWEWVYQPIDTAKETWYVKVGEDYYSWTAFLNKVNDELLTDETAEDKHLGFYFCKATERKDGTEGQPNVITAETFVGKVLFYLWGDVFKVYGIPSAIGGSKEWPYRKFYQTNGEVDNEKVARLMAQLKIDADAAERLQTAEE